MTIAPTFSEVSADLPEDTSVAVCDQHGTGLPLVLRQKVAVPRLPGAVVARPRLDALYDELLRRRTALAVLAAAGSGKTVQTQLFACHRRAPVAWLTLDHGDRSPKRLLRYLAAALAPHADMAEATVERALEQGTRPDEAAAALAETVEAPDLLVVIDQCEAVAQSGPACSVIEKLLDYFPSSVRAMLLGRAELPMSLGRLILQGRVARITGQDLALTLEETESLLEARGDDLQETRTRWEHSGGWVAGVAFGSPRSNDGGERFDFHAYLAAEVLGQVTTEQRQFLIETSVLDVVSQPAAAALCGPQAQAAWSSVTGLHLPARRTGDRTIVYHPCFRDYLQECLAASRPDQVAALQARHAWLLAESGRDEEATELLIGVGLLDEAVEPARRAARMLAQRGDWEVLVRWVAALGFERAEPDALLLAAYLRLLRRTRWMGEAQRAIAALDAAGRLGDIVAADPEVTVHLAWSMLWNPEQALDILDRYDGDRNASGVRYLLEAAYLADPAIVPKGRISSTTVGFVRWALAVQGRLTDLAAVAPPGVTWEDCPETTPYTLLGLIWRDELTRARELFDRGSGCREERGDNEVWCHVEAWLLMEEGDPGAALVRAEQAARQSRRTGVGFPPVLQITQARALLALGHVDDAEDVIEDTLALCRRTGFLAYREWAEMLLGRVRLLRQDPVGATELLGAAVQGMQRAERLLHLPMAAVYLAEAERQLGHHGRAGELLTLANHVATRTGAYRVLKDALNDCPSLLGYRADEQRVKCAPRSVPDVERCVSRTIGVPPTTVEIQPFGPTPDIIVRGAARNVRRVKVLELACLLASHPEGYRRRQAQLCLFPDSDQRRGGNHFRQVVHQLRKLTGLTLERLPSDRIAWSSQFQVISRDLQFEQALAEARNLVGAERLLRLQQALSMVSGAYLPASDLEWTTSRRFELEVLQEEAEAEAANLSLELGEHAFARECAESILARNPYSDVAYRVLISVEVATGTESAALALYRQAVAARREIGLGVDPTMAALLSEATLTMPGIA